MGCLVLTDRGVELTGLHPDGILQDGDILLEVAGEYMPDMIELEWESFSKKLREHQDHNIVAVRYKGIQGGTRGYKDTTVMYKGVQGGTRGYKGIQGGTRGYKGVQGPRYFKRHSRYPAKSKVCKRFPSSSL